MMQHNTNHANQYLLDIVCKLILLINKEIVVFTTRTGKKKTNFYQSDTDKNMMSKSSELY